MSQIKANLQVSPQDVFNIVTTTQGTDLGAYATTGDGRVFRYAKVGATALVPGTLVQGPAENTTIENLAPVAAAAGVGVITLTTSAGAVTANSLVGGYVASTTGAGYGYAYKIAGHAFVGTSLTITLEDPLVVALTTSSRLDVVPSPFNGVVINPTTPTGTPLGVAVSAIPASSFGWIQSHGPVVATGDATASLVGQPVGASRTTAGNITASTTLVGATYLTNVGVALTGIAASESGSVFLEID